MTSQNGAMPPLAGSGARLGTLRQINVSGGGVPKSPIETTRVGPDGLPEDRQQNLRHHGGPDKAICLWSVEIIEALSLEGHDLSPGSTGENFSVGGIDWTLVVPGALIKVGEAIELQITGFARPCRANAQWFLGGDFRRMSERHHRGWSRVYARVISGGAARIGDMVAVVPEHSTPSSRQSASRFGANF